MDSAIESKPRVCYEFEIEKVIAVSNDGSYQVQWAPAWVSKFHLVGCEHLIQQFLQRQQQLEKGNGGERQEVSPQGSAFSTNLTIQATNAHNECTLTDSFSAINPPGYADNKGSLLIPWHCQGPNNLLRQPDHSTLICAEGVNHSVEESQLNSTQVDCIKVEDDDGSCGNDIPDSVLMVHNNATLSSAVAVKDRLENNPLISPGDKKISTKNAAEGSGWIELTEIERLTTEDTVANNASFSFDRNQYDDNEHTTESETTATHQEQPSNHKGDSADLGTYSVDWNYSCHLCNESFSNKGFLDNHFLIHVAEGPYTCNTCNKDFHRPKSFNLHLRSHSGKKVHACSYCNSTFGSSWTLKEHMHAHTGEKPYKCSVCGKAFGWKANFIRHMRIHTGDKHYCCDKCGMDFPLRKSRDRHSHCCFSAQK